MTKISLLLALMTCACLREPEPQIVDQPLGGQTNLPAGGTGCTLDDETGVCSCRGPDSPTSPIVVDLTGAGFGLGGTSGGLTGVDDPVSFQLANHPGLWSWLGRDNNLAWLVLDQNNNGRIDNGTEMFGDHALQPFGALPNGFDALAFYDRLDQGGNGDGVIDASDAVWPRLRLWRDADHDGLSEGELSTLDRFGIVSFSTTAVASAEVDSHGNEFRLKGTLATTRSSTVNSVVYDVWLRSAAGPEVPSSGPIASVVGGLYQCRAWAYSAKFTGYGNRLIACTNTNIESAGATLVVLRPHGIEYNGDTNCPVTSSDLGCRDAYLVRANFTGGSRQSGCATAMVTVDNMIGGCGVFSHDYPDPLAVGRPYPYDGIIPDTDGEIRCVCDPVVVPDPTPPRTGC